MDKKLNMGLIFLTSVHSNFFPADPKDKVVGQRHSPVPRLPWPSIHLNVKDYLHLGGQALTLSAHLLERIVGPFLILTDKYFRFCSVLYSKFFIHEIIAQLQIRPELSTCG